MLPYGTHTQQIRPVMIVRTVQITCSVAIVYKSANHSISSALLAAWLLGRLAVHVQPACPLFARSRTAINQATSRGEGAKRAKNDITGS